jgi:hypothetical protein
MTTKRKRTQSTSREGINFVRSLVESQNSTFQEIDLNNDLGNDAYVEFVVDENATGCCVALQIKSGKSYQTANGQFAFQSDRDHFEYWSSHTLPVLAVIFDPSNKRATWVDITNHLTLNPTYITNGPYIIYAYNEFSESTFQEFRNHCLQYRDHYSQESNFGRALKSFSIREDIERCYDGLSALFAYHRNQLPTWYYLISCLSNYKEHPILRSLIARLCHIPGHGDIFWNKNNRIDEEVRLNARAFMRERFNRTDALTLLSAIDESGIDRGTIGQSVHSLIEMLEDSIAIMESIAIDPNNNERVRHSAILFATSSAQQYSPEVALQLLDRLRPFIEDNGLKDVIDWLEWEITQHGYASFY